MITTKLLYKSAVFFMASSLILIGGCRDDDPTPVPDSFSLVFDFEGSPQGWTGDFADLPVDGQDIFELEVSHGPLPEELDLEENALRIQGHNRSDDLFMFFKRQVDDLLPSTAYSLVFEIELASQYPEESVGIGGSPGASVFLKAGATLEEPETVVEEGGIRDYLRMNIDKGNQSQDGSDMYGLGTIGISGEEFRYELINRNNQDRPFTVTSSPEGTLWLVVGTDSGFEGLTELYYNRITVTFTQQ
ncbi:hypothetical protein [Pleomorphovibrio marinus]|uniref:hypothetical protein n=1 Tax=Pleomorphovibrio marinus TaxID=2164132 RepID=UPI000E0AAB27|nr:hypothetical protein [Pleomorphovibrio marinus]